MFYISGGKTLVLDSVEVMFSVSELLGTGLGLTRDANNDNAQYYPHRKNKPWNESYTDLGWSITMSKCYSVISYHINNQKKAVWCQAHSYG